MPGWKEAAGNHKLITVLWEIEGLTFQSLFLADNGNAPDLDLNTTCYHWAEADSTQSG